jgi:5'-3' exonuclease
VDADDGDEQTAVARGRLERGAERGRGDVGTHPQPAGDGQHRPPHRDRGAPPLVGEAGTGETQQRRVAVVDQSDLATLELEADPAPPREVETEEARHPDEPGALERGLERRGRGPLAQVGDEQRLATVGQRVHADGGVLLHLDPARPVRSTLAASVASDARGGDAIVRLLAVDGSSIAHRAWHSTRGATGGDDLTAVVAAMASMLASTWRHGPYDVALVALDHPVNRRRELFPAYKAQRSPTEPGLRAVLDALPAALRAASVPVRVQEGAEADDLLAAAADGGDRRGWWTDLLSSDRDLTALVGPRVRLLRPRQRFADLAVEDVAAVEAAHGVPPIRYRDLAALRGDPSDGLEGAPGIGPATAARLLREHDDVPALYRSLADLPPRIADSLRRGREAVERNLLLMAPLPHLDADLDAARAAGPPLAGLVADLEARGAGGAAARLRRALDRGADGPAASMPPPPERPA